MLAFNTVFSHHIVIHCPIFATILIGCVIKGLIGWFESTMVYVWEISSINEASAGIYPIDRLISPKLICDQVHVLQSCPAANSQVNIEIPTDQ